MRSFYLSFIFWVAISGATDVLAIDHQKASEWVGKWENQKDPKAQDPELHRHWKNFQIVREGDDYFFKPVVGSRMTKLEFNSSTTRATGNYMMMGMTASNGDRLFSELTMTLSNGILSVRVERSEGWLKQFQGRFRHKFEKKPK